MTSRRLRGLAITALLLLAACGTSAPAHIPAPVTLPRFENPAATRILVATFPSLPIADLADALPGLIEGERRRFEAMAPLTGGASPRALEVKRIDITLERHAEAREVLTRVGADILVWGSSGCRGGFVSATERSEPAAMCLHVTIDPAPRDRDTPTDKQLHLDRLTDFNLPPLAPSSRLGLARYLVGIHFRGEERYPLAARAFSEAATLIGAEGREHTWIDAYLAQVYLELHDEPAAAKCAEAALLGINNVGGAVESEINLTLGELRMKAKSPAAAIAYYNRSLLVSEKVLAEGHPHFASIENHLGHALVALDDRAGALRHFQRARVLDEAFLGPDHLDVAYDWEKIGTQMAFRGDTGAVEALERAEALYRVKAGPESYAVARVEERLGMAFTVVGDHARAIEKFRRAIAILGNQRIVDVTALMFVSNSLARSLSAHGDHADALVTLRMMLANSHELDGPGSRKLAENERRLANELLKTDNSEEYQEAMTHLLAALSIDVTVYGAISVEVSDDEIVVGQIMLQHEDTERATEHFLKALGIEQANLEPRNGRLDDARTAVAIAIAALSGRKPDEKSDGVVLVDCRSRECTDSGLKRGDWMLSLGAKKIRDEAHLLELIRGTPAKRPVTLTLRRGGKQINLQMRGREALQFSFTGQVVPKR